MVPPQPQTLQILSLDTLPPPPRPLGWCQCHPYLRQVTGSSLGVARLPTMRHVAGHLGPEIHVVIDHILCGSESWHELSGAARQQTWVSLGIYQVSIRQLALIIIWALPSQSQANALAALDRLVLYCKGRYYDL